MLITNACVINEGKQFDADVLIVGERIERIAPQISCPAGHAVYDAKGRTLIPGMIDDQVHFREPGLTHKGNLATESAAAVAGGITSVFDMPNNNPTITTRERLAEKYAMAAGRMHSNYAFYFGAANDNAEEVARLQPDEACAVKVFMGASTGNMLVDDPTTLSAIFSRSKLMVVTHCEDTPMILVNEAAARARWGEDVPFEQHPLIRSEAACYASTELAVRLAKEHGARLHVLHLTTARELAFFAAGPVKDKQITVEACVHHLYFDELSYATRGADIKCNPAVKRAEDRVALVAAVKAGIIDVVATDHAPHTREEKDRSYFKAPSGLPLVQHALPMLLTLAARGELSLFDVVERTSHNVARLFGVQERGFIREGAYADLALIDPDQSFRVTRDSVRYHCGWSPLEGDTLTGQVEATWVNGEKVYDGGVLQPAPKGQRLRFASRF